MAAQRKRQIPADVSQGDGPSANPVTYVDEEGKIQEAPELFTAMNMKEETLPIVQEVEKFYNFNLGPCHTLTRAVQRRIDSLREQEYVNTLWGRLRRWFHRFLSLLTRDTEDDDDDDTEDDDDDTEDDDDDDTEDDDDDTEDDDDETEDDDDDETDSNPDIHKNV